MKLLKTNTKQYYNNFNNTMKDNFIDHGGDIETASDFLNEFDSCCNTNYEKRMYPNLQMRLEQYLSGAPSAFSFCYANEMINFACIVHELDQLPAGKDDIIVSGFYSHCSMMILRIARKEGYNLENLY